MNTFKRELLVILRSWLFLFIVPISIFLISLPFNKNIIDIEIIYNLFPFLLSFIIPLMSSSIWQRERRLGLDGQLILSNIPLSKIIKDKISAHFIIYCFLIILEIPLVFILSGFGFIDYGQLFVINISLLLFSFLGVVITLLYSVIVKSRVLVITLSFVTLLLIILKSDMLYTFFKGKIDLSDILFYLASSLLIIYLTLGFLKFKVNKIKIVTAVFLLISSIFITTTIDSTTLRIFTIKPYTKKVVEKLNTKMEINYFYSSKLLDDSSLIKDILDLLNQFNHLKNVDVSVIEDSDTTFNSAVRRYKPTKSDTDMYNFIVIKYGNSFQVIPQIPFSHLLEFEILKVFKYLINGGLKKVGIYIGNEEFTEDNFNVLRNTLNENFFTTFLFPGDVIPENLDSLIVIGHFGINNLYRDEIGHYLAHGGNILFAGTGLPTSENLEYRSTPILESLKLCGIVIEPYLIADNNNINDYELNVITTPNRALLGNPVLDPFTGFTGIYLSPVLVENKAFDELLYTSSLSYLVNSSTGLEGAPEGSFSVAVYGSGSFSGFFTDHGTESINRLMVLGNSISLTDYPYTIGISDSYDFITRSVYLLNGDDDLIDVRNSYNWDKTFYKLESSLYKESIINIVHIFLVIIYPLIILLFCYIIRKKAEK